MARVSNEKFVRTCLEARTLDQAAAALGMKKSGIQGRARRLRKAGVKLPRFHGGGEQVDAAALNGLIEAAEA